MGVSLGIGSHSHHLSFQRIQFVIAFPMARLPLSLEGLNLGAPVPRKWHHYRKGARIGGKLLSVISSKRYRLNYLVENGA